MPEAAYKYYEDEYVLKEVFDARMDRMEMLISKNFSELKSDIQALRTETKGEIQALKTETKGDIQALKTEAKGGIQALRNETNSSLQALRTETKGDIQALRNEIKGDIKTLDARLEGAIDTLSVAINKVDTRMDGLEKRIDDIHQAQSRNLALWGLIITVAVALIQHFWK